MKLFWVRFFIFSLLWVLVLILDSTHLPYSVLAYTISLGIFFLLSIGKGPLLLYAGLSFMIFLQAYFLVDGLAFTSILLLYTITDAAFRLKSHFHWYMTGNFLILVILELINDGFLVVNLFLYVLFYIVITALQQKTADLFEQRGIYDELLGEYRILKRLHVEAERDARLEERTKIARDIHDSVGHRLTALIMKLEMLSIQQGNSEYDELKKMAKESLDETRQAVKALQTEEYEGISTVVHLIRKLEAESHILVQFTMKQGVLSVKLSNRNSVALYRVIQEALTNAMRHAGSREVHITLGKSAIGDVSFEIKNAVFEPKPFNYGFGLSNMKSRVEDLQGSLHVYQTEKHFVVSGTIPGE
ncbi:hypothetical protein CIL03_14115 [Virgibacillus indicus]|uniref:histidine kinase n=1 Tax=Virgibacillus indicus TaxID=2024554 RepID=A0A265N7N2_9BACI|nr:sensor histidine kinase [Virgibacillus indicus]OZU87837.1 hypothetical protein CIL03_14115 [Virgibacillus indicus]